MVEDTEIEASEVTFVMIKPHTGKLGGGAGDNSSKDEQLHKQLGKVSSCPLQLHETEKLLPTHGQVDHQCK